ncbi:MAG: hypothetical protein IR158_04790 [Cellulomonas sp.]|uniref:hypothetical protein n=1 Tax=Cellulomonas sp. TaxID=40001 RepID=UPI0019F9B13B|nr:hypothetical protein [Cellulomonas sp.]MBF0687071.1 hypothetical protein [Cellulomonas sp.]
MRRSPALPLLAATVVALVLAGCSGDGTSSTSDEETGPMSAFFEKVGGSFDEGDAEKQQREHGELVAACMAEQGFEYTAPEPMGMTESEDMPEWNSKEYAEQFGYGATTSQDMNGGEEWVDPNADYLATMSEGEQTAFYEALYGVQPEVDPEADPEEYEYNWEEGGCEGKASHEVYEQGQIWDDPALQDFRDEMTNSWDSLADEPVLQEAQAKWSACMTEAGFDFASPQEAQDSIYDQMNVIWEASVPEDPEAEVDPEAFELDETAMAELKKEELAVAAADYTCKESSGYVKAEKAAYLAVEERLWEKYGDQLEAAAAKQTPAK